MYAGPGSASDYSRTHPDKHRQRAHSGIWRGISHTHRRASPAHVIELDPAPQQLRVHFLARLKRLADIKQRQPIRDMETQRLIAWAMISLYRDCVELDVGAAAEAMMRAPST